MAIIFIFTFFLLFTILDHINYLRAKRAVEREIKISNTQTRIWKLKLEFEKLIAENIFKDCPYTRKYISSNLNLFIKDGTLNLSEIYPSGSKNTEKIFQKMRTELNDLPQQGKKYLCDFFDVVFTLAEIQKQLFTKSVMIKKKIILQIMDCLIVICHKVLDISEKMHQFNKKIKKIYIIKKLFNEMLDSIRKFTFGSEYLKNVLSISTIIK